MTPTLDSLRKKIAKLHAPFDSAPTYFPRVTVILGSSRSGSSLLFHLLSKSGAFVAPQGEETPFYRLADRGWVDGPTGSDAIQVPVDAQACLDARRFLAQDLGTTNAVPLTDPRYLAQCASRLLLQWPHLTPRAVTNAFTKLAPVAKTAEDLWVNVITKLTLDIERYDLPGVRNLEAEVSTSDAYVEETPYIIQRPRGPADMTKPLLLKTSSNVYRLRWLRTLFPEAEFKFIHLRRNPAAGINGLIDGWLSNAFHSHDVARHTTLKIAGYSDVVPGGERWWKFDLPPGWSAYAHEPLPAVCGFQWQYAYQTMAAMKERALNIAFEDLINARRSRGILKRIFDYAGATPEHWPSPTDAPPIMASKKPGPARWRKREKEIWRLVQSPTIRATAEDLGYDLDAAESWL